METRLDKEGIHIAKVEGNEDELAALQKSYEHLIKMRDNVIEMGVIPPVAEWSKLNPNL